MQPHRRCLSAFSLLILMLPDGAWAEASEQRLPGHYVVIKGGLSLGNYESGLNWALNREFKQRSPKVRVVSFSGASAGGINALISAVEYCRAKPATSQGSGVGAAAGTAEQAHVCQNTDDSLKTNCFRSSWDLGVDALLNPDSKESRGAGVLSRSALRAQVDTVLRAFKDWQFEKNCSSILTLSVTRFTPAEETGGGGQVSVKKMRYIIPIKVNVSDAGELQFLNAELGLASEEIHFGPTDWRICNEELRDALMASAAFPVAFSPVSLRYCTQKCEQVAGQVTRADREDWFADGGAFDNAPVGVAVALRNTMIEQQGAPKGPIILVDPGNLDPERGPIVQDGKRQNKAEKIGLGEYFAYFGDVIDVSGTQLLWNAVAALDRDDLYVTSRRFPLTADYHAHFGAFYAKEFRAHDYLVGVYDGLFNGSKLGDKERKTAAVKEDVCAKIEALNDRKVSLQELEFLRFLWKSEFGGACPGGTESFGEPLAIATAGTVKARPNPYVLIQLAAQNSPSNKNTGRMIPFLKKLAESAGQNKDRTFEQPTWELLSDPESWFAKKGKTVVDRTVEIQEDSKTSANKSIEGLLKATRPMMKASIDQLATGYWPTGYSIGALDYGIAHGENSQVFTYRTPPIPLPWPKLALEPSISYHLMAKREKVSDHFSKELAVKHHNENFLFSSWQAGGDLSDGNVWRGSVGVGVLGETLHFKAQAKSFDAEVFAIVQLDLFRLAAMLGAEGPERQARPKTELLWW